MENGGTNAARAEAVGSLMRPPAITHMIQEIYAGQTMAHPSVVLPQKAAAIAAFERACDAGVRELVAKQVAIGLDVVNDGEIRRPMFPNSLTDGMDGLVPMPTMAELPGPDDESFQYFGDPIFGGKLGKTGNPLVAETVAMRQVDAPVPFKLTIPTPTMYLHGYLPAPQPYPTMLEMLEDAAGIVNEMAVEAVAAGATWLQFDGPFYPTFDPAFGGDGAMSAHETAKALGMTAHELLTRAVEIERTVVAGLGADVVTATHICRGNMLGSGRSVFQDEFAERTFAEVPYHRWLIEWEDPARHGDFSALRFVPSDKVVVLGLISTKTPELEDEDEIVRKIEEASQYIAVDQLAISPQCGFSSVAGYELVGREDVQWRKLELVRRVADRVWGR